ncbi:MAG: SHOCT domain-containing protein [Chloroflexaceae bacterium]|nr:SHOCT domain-containing protein [Chloroflexaceae bacterium]
MGLLKTAAKAAVASSVHGRVQRRQQQRWARQEDAAAETAGTPAMPMASAPAQTDIQQQLALVAQLVELRDAGALSEAEFEVKKAQILGL